MLGFFLDLQNFSVFKLIIKSPSSYRRSLPPRANPGQGTLLTTHHSLLGERPAQWAEGTASEPNRSRRFQRWPAGEPGGEVQEGGASRVSIPRDGERGRPWPSAGLGASARGGRSAASHPRPSCPPLLSGNPAEGQAAGPRRCPAAYQVFLKPTARPPPKRLYAVWFK